MTDKLVLPENWIAVPMEATAEMRWAGHLAADEARNRNGGYATSSDGEDAYNAMLTKAPPCPVLTYAEVRRKVLEEARDAVAKSPFLRAYRGHYIDIIDALIDGGPTYN